MFQNQLYTSIWTVLTTHRLKMLNIIFLLCQQLELNAAPKNPPQKNAGYIFCNTTGPYLPLKPSSLPRP